MKEIKTDQIDNGLHCAELSDHKAVSMGSGMIVHFKVQTYGKSKAVAKEKVLFALAELNFMIEDYISKFEI